MILSRYEDIILIQSDDVNKWGVHSYAVVTPTSVEQFHTETGHSDAERCWTDYVLEAIYK